MRTKQIISICLLILSIGLLSFDSQNNTGETKKTSNSVFRNYKTPTPGEITILADTPIPPHRTVSEAAFQQLADCGFNSAIFTGDINECKKALEQSEKVGVKLMVHNKNLLNEKCKSFVDSLNLNKNLGGWYFKDEPQYDQLDNLSKAYNRLESLNTGKLIYINLVGSAISKFTGEITDYKEYLNLIEDIFHPDVWSYDHYPFLIKNGKVEASYDSFYSDLEDFRNISEVTGVPFWAYCQSMAFKNSVIERPAPTENYLRFETYNALAYGAQGIVYWTYGQRETTKYEEYFSALVNLEGEKYPAWYAAKKVNEEIKRFNDVFYRCKVFNISHTGNKIYAGCRKFKNSSGPLKKVISGKEGVVISEIENKDKKYIIIVNKDFSKNQKVELYLKNSYSLKQLTTNNINMDKIKNKITLDLQPSDWQIFLITN